MRLPTMAPRTIVSALAVMFAARCSDGVMDPEVEPEAILERLEQLEHEIGVQRDIEEIRRLQFAYNYYNSNGFQDHHGRPRPPVSEGSPARADAHTV